MHRSSRFGRFADGSAIFVLALVLFLVPTGWLAESASGQQDSPSLAITHGPYLQLPSVTSMTIVWHTNRPAVSRVEYGLTDSLGNVAVNAEHGLIANDRTSHVVRIAGLAPGKTYKYRVVSREFKGYEKQHIVRFGAAVTSEIFSFTTLNSMAAPYSFVFVSDTHENAKRLDTMLGNVDWRRTPFVVFGGDMVNDFMNPDQPFSAFLDASVARFARGIPFIYVRGNHDVRGRYARKLADYFPTQNGHAYYSFDHGPVHFIVLDSGEDKADGHEYYNGLVAFEQYRAEQARWLAEDLRTDAARRAQYRIVLSHIPPYEGTRRPAGKAEEEGYAIQQVRANWEAPANAGGVDLWLSGHMHRYAHVARTAGANRYDLIVGSTDTLTRVDVSPRELVVTVTRESGEQVGSVRVPGRE